MKRVAFYCLHYGKEYLAWSIRSVQEVVDEIIVIYSDKPSFGFRTNDPCPESEEELKTEAHRFLKKPLLWHRGTWGAEGAHRDSVFAIAAERGAKQILVVDSDEIWHPEDAKNALDIAATRPERNIPVRFVHFWKSLNWVCRDAAMPLRIVNTEGTKATWFLPPQKRPVLHFGYAQSNKIVKYKMSIHGHKNELRQGWFESKYEPWTPQSGIKDVHPTNYNYWDPMPVDTLLSETIKELIGDHPYIGRETI